MNEEKELARVVNGSWCVSKEQLDYFVNLEKENQQLKEDIKAYEQERNNLINSIPFKQNKRLENKINKAIDKLSFIDEALENDTLNVPLCIAKINKTLEILKGDNNEC